jgi:hypothetical protein
MPKSLIVSQLPQLHQDAGAFPLPIHLHLFEASQDGEQEFTDTCCAHILGAQHSSAWFLSATGNLYAQSVCLMDFNNVSQPLTRAFCVVAAQA